MEKDETFLGVSSCIVAACTVARVASSKWREFALRHAYKGFAQKNQGERLVLGGPVLRMQVAGRLFYGKRGARLAMRPLRRRRAGVICGRTSLQCCDASRRRRCQPRPLCSSSVQWPPLEEARWVPFSVAALQCQERQGPVRLSFVGKTKTRRPRSRVGKSWTRRVALVGQAPPRVAPSGR